MNVPFLLKELKTIPKYIFRNKFVIESLCTLTTNNKTKEKLRSKIVATPTLIPYKSKFNIQIETPLKTIEHLIETGSSICRFGDGEFLLIEGRSIAFQTASNNLQGRLKEVLSSQDQNISIGTNYYYWNKPYKFRPTPLKFYKRWVPKNLEKIEEKLDINKQYYDAGFTQPYATYIDYDYEKHFELLKKLWEDRDITIISGKGILDDITHNIFNNARSVELVEAPSKNAFDTYDNLLTQSLKINKNRLIIIILGPTATILAYDLAKNGFQALDLGHVAKDYDWYKKEVIHTKDTLTRFYSPD